MRASLLGLSAILVLGQLVATVSPAAGECPPNSKADADGDGIPCSLDNCILTPNSSQANTDGDSRGNACDNCDQIPNDQPPLYQATSAQCDADTDGFGNSCDCDFNQDGFCNSLDIAALAMHFNQPAVTPLTDAADSNCDGNVNALDIGNLATHFNKAMSTGPKTSGLACASPTLARPGGCNTAFGE